MRDKSQKFATGFITREQIAEELNHALGREEFKTDDARLTDDFCIEFAGQYGTLISDMAVEADNTGDAWVNLGNECATKLGVSV